MFHFLNKNSPEGYGALYYYRLTRWSALCS
uniref:Uncharacterized protein n=1 Tax=Anguilla anguilla TaxID=7936 RepID=A0A0E9W4Q5_ANGAN